MFDNLIAEKFQIIKTKMETNIINDLNSIDDLLVNLETKSRSTKEKKEAYVKSFNEFIRLKFENFESEATTKQEKVMAENAHVYRDFFVRLKGS